MTVEEETAHQEPSSSTLARRRHYGEFYGLEPLPGRFGLILGNCQAESIRLVIDRPEERFIRVPPVHEFSEKDARRLHQLLPLASTVITQPIRADYRGLPVGTSQVAGRTRAQVVTVPPVRYGGLHPYQIAMRSPLVTEDPPIVAYHDVRTLAEAAGVPVARSLAPEAIRRIGESTLAELRRREGGTDVRVSDLFDPLSADHCRTINHPGNAVWLPVGARVLRAMGSSYTPVDPGRPLLDSVRAPLSAWVIDAWGLGDEPRDCWVLEGNEVSDEQVRAAHLRWYANHPAFVEYALSRAAGLMGEWRKRP